LLVCRRFDACDAPAKSRRDNHRDFGARHDHDIRLHTRFPRSEKVRPTAARRSARYSRLFAAEPALNVSSVEDRLGSTSTCASCLSVLRPTRSVRGPTDV